MIDLHQQCVKRVLILTGMEFLLIHRDEQVFKENANYNY